MQQRIKICLITVGDNQIVIMPLVWTCSIKWGPLNACGASYGACKPILKVVRGALLVSTDKPAMNELLTRGTNN